MRREMDGLELNISTEPAAPRVHTTRTKKLHRRAWKGLDGRHRKQHRDAAAGGASIRVKEAPLVGPLPGKVDARKRKGVADGGAGPETKTSVVPGKKAVVSRGTVQLHASVDQSVAGGKASDEGRSTAPQAKRAKIVKARDEGGAPFDHHKAEGEAGGAGGKGTRSKSSRPTHAVKATVAEPTVAVSGQVGDAEAGKTVVAAKKAAALSKKPQARLSQLPVDVKASEAKPTVQSGAAAVSGKPNTAPKQGAEGGATRGKQNAKDERRTYGVQEKGLDGGRRAKLLGVTPAGSGGKGGASTGQGPGGILVEEGAVQQGRGKQATSPASNMSDTKAQAKFSRENRQPSPGLTGSSSVKKQESPAGFSRRHPAGAVGADQRQRGSKPTQGRDAALAKRCKKRKLPPAWDGAVEMMSDGDADEEDAEAMGEERATRKKPAPVEQQRLNEYHARPSELSATALPTPLSSKTSKHIFTTTDVSELGLHDRLVDVLRTPKEHHGFGLKTATRVQSAALPAVLRGKNALISSETGSGKTLAYLLPILQQLQAIEPPACRSGGTHVLVVSPTRELCHQIYNVLMRLVRPFIRIVPGIVTGGEKRKSEKARLRKGIMVLVGTPGRLLDHLQNTQSFKYDHAQWLVLDEVDRLLDMGFESQVRSIVKQIRSKGQGSVQLVAASATITTSVDWIARSLLGRHLRVDAKTSTVEEVEGEIEDVVGDDGDAEQVAGEAHTDEELHGDDDDDDDDDDDVEGKPASPARAEPAKPVASEQFITPKQLAQQYMLATCKLRLPALASVLRIHAQKHKAVVFMSTCDSVDFHHALFTKTSWPTEKGPLLGEAIPVYRLHGNIPQAERLQNLRTFSESKVGVLFCTDVASRGLDLPSVDWIIQYDPPTDAAEYVHRVGRTARRGQKGYALLFLLPSERGFLGALKDKGLEPSPLSLQHTLAAATPSRFARFRAPEEVFTIELQQGFEKAVEEDVALLKLGRLAFQSFVRAYAAHSVDLKHIFMVRGLHLGHVAKSFALRSPPTALKVGKQQIKIPQAKKDEGAADTKTKRKGSGDDRQSRTKKQKVDEERPQKQWLPGKKSLLSMASEFASGSVAKELRTSWALKCISLAHALIVAPTAIWALLAEPGTHELTRAIWRFDTTYARRSIVYAVSPTAAAVVPVTMGYFIFDLLLLPYWEGTPDQWLPMILHHGISLLTWPLGLVNPACHYFLLVCISMEASTPFVQLRWMIRQHTSKDGILYYVNGVIMTLSFLACRVAIIPHNVWAILVGAPHSTTSGLPPYMRLATSVLIIPNILNLYWARIMVKGLVTMVTKKSKKSVQKAEETVLCKTKAV